MHGARDQYHGDSSAMCHLMPSRKREQSKSDFQNVTHWLLLCIKKGGRSQIAAVEVTY